MPTRDLFVRMVRAGGVAIWAATVPVAFLEFRDRYQNPAQQGDRWPWGSLWPLTVGALLALAAPWIGRRFRWRDDALPGMPVPATSLPVRLRSAWLLVAVAALGATLIALLVTTNVFGRSLAGTLGWGGLGLGAAVPVAVLAYGLARSTSADVPHRDLLLLAVLRAGAVFGLACSVAGAGRFLDDLLGFFGVGGELSEHFLPYFVELVLTPIVWVTWMAIFPRRLRDPAPRGEPARPRHVLPAVAATMAIALVAPTAATVEGWRWRVDLYARVRAEAREAPPPPVSADAPPVLPIRGDLIFDGLPLPGGFAQRAWMLTAGFAGFVIVAAVAGRRRRDARPGR